MTRDEAKDLLDNLNGMIEDSRNSDYDTAFKMAIKALEQEPCEDCVRRQEVLDILDDMVKDYIKENDFDKAQGVAWVKVQKLPPVTPQPKMGRWIPVSERMPEDNELVLFSTKTDRVFEGRYFGDNTDRQWYSFRDEAFAWNNVVTAWMPLPEPYRAESEDKE